MRISIVITAALLAACSPSPAPEAVQPESAGALHERILTLDTHLDTPVHFERPGWNFAERRSFETDLSHVDLPRMREGGLDGGFFVLYTPQGPTDAAGFANAKARADRRLAAMLRTLEANRSEIALATRADEAEAIARSGRRIAFLSVENSYPLGPDVAAMRTGLADWYRAGIRMAGPVHNGGNQFGDSASGGTQSFGGLSQLGRRWVEEMNRLGMIIDGSHASDAALAQLMDLSATPVILSHSGLKAIFDHPRNITDDQLRALAAQGGVLHINSVFLTRYNMTDRRRPLSARMDRMSEMTPAEQRALAAEWAALDREERVNDTGFDTFMAALLRCLQIAGVDHCGIGADWDGGGGVREFEDVTALPRITARLIEAGYSASDVEKIWSGNILRVMRQVELHAASLRR